MPSGNSEYTAEVVLDYNPDNFPSKFRKFVTELPALMDTVKLANVF
jgi:hypothetical protein